MKVGNVSLSSSSDVEFVYFVTVKPRLWLTVDKQGLRGEKQYRARGFPLRSLRIRKLETDC